MGRLRFRFPFWLGVLAAAHGAAAAPFVFHRGVVNAASYLPAGLPNGSIARGSIFSLFGRELGPATPATVSAFPLQTTLAGVAVEVCQGGACADALPLFVSASQINAVMPSDAPLGAVSIRVRADGQAGNFTPAAVVSSSVGVFAVSSAGFGPGIVQNYLAADNQPINSATRTARPGQVVTLWATGLGPALNADNVAPQAGDLPIQVEIFVGGKAVTHKLYSGRSPCCAGVDQIVFEIPADAPLGCYVPVAVRTGAAVVSNDVTISLSGDGGPCSDAEGAAGAALRQGGKLGGLTVTRGRLTTTAGPVGADTLEALFTEERGGPWAYQPLYSPPPAGACAVSAGRGDAESGLPPVRTLDAGATAYIERGGRSLGMALPSPGRGLAGVASSAANGASASLLDAAGPFTAGVTGGTDAPAFTVGLQSPAAASWNNRAALAVVDRAREATLTWAPPAEGGVSVWIAGHARSRADDATARFLCRVPDGATSFTIPTAVLGRLPAAEAGPDAGLALIFERRTENPPPPGLDFLQAIAASAALQVPRYQ